MDGQIGQSRHVGKQDVWHMLAADPSQSVVVLLIALVVLLRYVLRLVLLPCLVLLVLVLP